MSNEEKKNTVEILPVIPLRNVVVFPHMMMPLFVGRQRSIRALEKAYANKSERKLWVVAQKDGSISEPSAKDMYATGTIARIIQLTKMPDGTVRVILEGKERAVLDSFVETQSMFEARVIRLQEPKAEIPEQELESLRRELYAVFENYLDYVPRLSKQILNPLKNAKNPGQIADMVAVTAHLSPADKQTLLETIDPVERLRTVISMLKRYIEVLKAEGKSNAAASRQKAAKHDPTQEFNTLEDEYRQELKEIEEQIEKKGMSPEAKEKALKELKRLKMMSPMSAEATVSRNYIDWLLSIPWSEKTEDNKDITRAKEVLEEDHYGLEKVKERILEYLAVRMLSGSPRGQILCFVGPPGVGKTSVAKSIARAMNRKFVRMSLGGVHDEAEIRGHRRTYIGALPGKIIQHMKKAGTINPVFLLDEVDKISYDFLGDPASALLEALDPEQNKEFQDHYLDVDYDLSNVVFITTANYLQKIPAPLQDRMDIIELHGYTEEEKVEIAKRYLIPRQIEQNGLKEDNVEFTEGALKEIIRSYTREAGVRTLERRIASVCRKIAIKVLEEEDGKNKKWKITKQNVKAYLGVPRYKEGVREEEDLIGVANGLAWTEFGGDILQIEVLMVPGDGKLTITGKLGEVMQESARAALMYIRSRADKLGIDHEIFKKTDIHIHVQEGAVPKDGPSAGITMALAIASALTGIPVRHDIAMTGEITLRGRVLPIGGLKEKMLAAYRNKIHTVIIPDDNQPNLEDVPDTIAKEIRVIPVKSMDEVLEIGMVKSPFVAAAAIKEEGAGVDAPMN